MRMKPKRLATIRTSTYTFAICILLPIVIVFLIIRIIPIAGTVVLGFFKWNLAQRIREFIGLSNYIKLFSNYLFHTALKNTIILTFLSIAITIVLAFCLALATNRRNIRYKSIYRVYEAIFFLPFIFLHQRAKHHLKIGSSKL